MANNEMLALDLDLFDVQKNAYVPQETPKKRIQKPKLLETKPVSRMQTAQEARESTKMAIRACAFALTMFLTIGAIIVCHVQLTNLQIDLTKKQNELKRFFTILSSNEWKVIIASLPEGFSTSNISSSAFSSFVSS